MVVMEYFNEKGEGRFAPIHIRIWSPYTIS